MNSRTGTKWRFLQSHLQGRVTKPIKDLRWFCLFVFCEFVVCGWCVCVGLLHSGLDLDIVLGYWVDGDVAG